MSDEIADTETETYEHIPWSQLTLTNEAADRGRWMYFIAALLIAAALAAVVARMVWRPEVAAAAPSTSFITQPSVVEVPETVEPPAVYSEADLMAASPPLDVARKVATAAERYVREWANGSGDSWRYVEWVAAESVDDLGDGLFRVSLAMQLLVGGESGTVRLPVEGLDVMVKVAGDSTSVVDLPIPAVMESVAVTPPVVEPAVLSELLTQAALRAADPWGSGTIVGGGIVGDRWRVEVSVESPSGPVRLIAVWLTPDGSPTLPVP